jgi:hypothetical protein
MEVSSLSPNHPRPFATEYNECGLGFLLLSGNVIQP